jgi:glycerol uptake facilitator-like aquaporin
MFNKLLAEIIGTFVFLGVIIFVVKGSKDMGVNWLKIGLALGIMILFVGSISGGHFNPAVSLMFYLNNQLPLEELGVYWIGQVVGAALALSLFKFYEADLGGKNLNN